MPSSAKPLTARCLAAGSCVRCGDGRCLGRKTSAGTPTRPCFASRLSSSSRHGSRHSSRPRGPQAITQSELTPLPTDVLLMPCSVCAGSLACCVCIGTCVSLGGHCRAKFCPFQLQSCHIGCQHSPGAACTMSSAMQHASRRFMSA